MSVINETTVEEKEQIVDDVSEPESKSLDLDKLAALKAKMGAVKEPKSKKKKTLRFGVIGSGQAGSRLAESFHKAGYPAIAINTAPQDLEFIEIPDDCKYLLQYGIGGAAKDLDIGKEAAEANRDGIELLVRDRLGDAQAFLVCLSLGGGSGAGSCETLIDIVSSTDKPILVITVLPMSTDDAQTKSNALTTLSRLAEAVSSKKICNLIVVDNAKIEVIFSDVGQMDFFKVSNSAIVDPIDAFNYYSSMPSSYKSLDPMEFAKIFTDGEGLSIYGEMVVADWENEMNLAESVVANLENGLLASGFDLKQAKYAGAIFVANKKVWDNIPSSSVSYAMHMIGENCPGADSVFKGLYVDDSVTDDVVKVYSMFSGLGLPANRVSQLKKDTEIEAAKLKERAAGRVSALALDTGKEKTISKADEIRAKIASKNSKFGKNFGGGDFRK